MNRESTELSIYEKNKKALKECHLRLYKSIMKIEKEWCCDWVDSVEARDGSSVIKVLKDGKETILNSQYSPLQEANRFVKQYSGVVDNSFMIIVGFGNGLIARQMMESLPENIMFYFYEPSIDIFMHVIHHYDVTDILSRKKLIITVKELNDELIDGEFGSIIKNDNYRISIMDALPKYKTLFPDDFKNVEEKYRYIIKLVRMNIDTAKYFGQLSARNNIYNMKALLNCNCEMEFDDVFPKNLPAIIVAAGPSLEKNVHLLKKAKGHALIIAVDSALRYLAAKDIQPDLAITVDPEKPVRLFEDERIKQIPLAIHSSANHDIIKLMSDKKILVFSSDNAYYNRMFQLVDKKMYTVQAGGSVATVAVSLAIAWGLRRIVLIGQDLSFGKDKVHAGNDDIDLEKLNGEILEIDGYYGEKVYTSPDYKHYLEWYGVVFGADKNLEVINATEGGARIDNTIQMPLSEVIDTYCTDSFDYEGTIRNQPPTFDEEGKKALLKMWNDSKKNLQELEALLNEGIRYAEEGILLVKKGNYSSNMIQDIHKKLGQVTMQCDKLEEIYFVDRMIAEEQEDVLADIYEGTANNDEEHCRMLSKLQEYFKAMVPAVNEVYQLFDDLIVSCEEV